MAHESSEIFAAGLLDGRVAIVTGGGTNLGREAAAELARCGARVVIAGRREDVLADAAARIGVRSSWIAGDIRDPDGAAAIARAAIDRHGRLDVLVNNAGGQYFVPAEDITAKGWAAVQRLNVDGTVTMTRAALDAGLGERGDGGAIVNVTVSPHHGMPAMAHTGAARAAVEAFGRELAADLAPRGIAVVSAALGRFDTESLRKYPEAAQLAAARSLPLGRLGEMREFGWLVALVASPLGRALSGSVVTLDGALDNFPGPWPPPALVGDDGTVPTEERRPAPH